MTESGLHHQTAVEIDAEMELVMAARKDPRKFEPLYTRYYKRIVTFVFHRINDREVAFDITSQVFYKALDKLHTFKAIGVPFSAWLFRIAANEVNLFFRKQKTMRTVSIDAGGLSELKDSFEEQPAALADQQLFEALQQLDEDEMELIDMRFFEKRSFREICDIKNLNESACKMRIYRILEKLKTNLNTLR